MKVLLFSALLVSMAMATIEVDFRNSSYLLPKKGFTIEVGELIEIYAPEKPSAGNVWLVRPLEAEFVYDIFNNTFVFSPKENDEDMVGEDGYRKIELIGVDVGEGEFMMAYTKIWDFEGFDNISEDREDVEGLKKFKIKVINPSS